MPRESRTKKSVSQKRVMQVPPGNYLKKKMKFQTVACVASVGVDVSVSSSPVATSPVEAFRIKSRCPQNSTRYTF
jgi:hypothetical protein